MPVHPVTVSPTPSFPSSLPPLASADQPAQPPVCSPASDSRIPFNRRNYLLGRHLSDAVPSPLPPIGSPLSPMGQPLVRSGSTTTLGGPEDHSRAVSRDDQIVKGFNIKLDPNLPREEAAERKNQEAAQLIRKEFPEEQKKA